MSIISLISNQGIKNASASIEDVSKRFATGERLTKPSEDLFASIQIATGREKLTYYDSALASLQRLRSVLATRNGSLQTMKSGVEQLASLALKSSSAVSDAERNSAVVSFNQVMSRVANIATTSEYAGIKLLDGSFGGSDGFAPVGDVYNLSVLRSPTGVAGGLAAAANASQAVTVAFNNIPAIGDTITVDGKTVTFVDEDANPEIGRVLRGSSAAQAAKNALTALNAMEKGNVLKYQYSITGLSTLKINSLVSSNTSFVASVVVQSGGNIGAPANVAAAGAPVINFNGYTDRVDECAGQLGLLSVNNFAVVAAAAAGDDVLQATYTATVAKYGPAATAIKPADAVGDKLVETSFYIGSIQYKGLIMSNAATANSQTVMVCKRADVDTAVAGQTFTVNLSAAVGIADRAAAAASLTPAWNDASIDLTVVRNQRMAIDTDQGDILNSDNQTIGSVKGMSVQLLSGSMNSNKVIGVEIGKQEFSFTVNDGSQDKVFVGNSANANTAVAGEVITCTCADTNEVLTFVVGNTDLDISTKDNQQLIQRAIFSALSTNNATFIVGTDVTQTLDMKLADMSWGVLTSNQNLNLVTQDSAREAATLLQNVVTQINSEIAVNAAYDLAVSSLVDQTNVSKENLTSAVESLSNVDITAEKTQLDNMMTLVRASVTAMTTDLQLRRAIEQVLNQ